MNAKTVIINRGMFNEAVQAYCKRNGVAFATIARSHGLSRNYDCNGRNTFQRKHPECKMDYIELSEPTYQQLCTVFLLTPERYIISDFSESAAPENPVEQKVSDKTVVAYIRMLNERLLDIEKRQQEQTDLLKRLLEVWEKT